MGKANSAMRRKDLDCFESYCVHKLGKVISLPLSGFFSLWSWHKHTCPYFFPNNTIYVVLIPFSNTRRSGRRKRRWLEINVSKGAFGLVSFSCYSMYNKIHDHSVLNFWIWEVNWKSGIQRWGGGSEPGRANRFYILIYWIIFPFIPKLNSNSQWGIHVMFRPQLSTGGLFSKF